MIVSETYNEDCMIGMSRYPDKYFDLAVCDPPYGINVAKLAYTQEENRPCKQKNGTILRVKKLKYKHSDWDKEPPSQEYYNELVRVSKNQIIWGVNYYNWIGIGKGRIKWNKGVPDGVSFSNYEYAYCSCIDNEIEVLLLWAGMCQAKSLLEPMTQQGNKKLNEKRILPTHKPIMLYDWTYQRFATEGMKIIDTHLGGGSNRISADKNKLNFWAWELDKEYFDAAMKRFEVHKMQQILQFQ
jgi:site-specific DNA-methyltransferase (adenine-specific)